MFAREGNLGDGQQPDGHHASEWMATQRSHAARDAACARCACGTSSHRLVGTAPNLNKPQPYYL